MTATAKTVRCLKGKRARALMMEEGRELVDIWDTRWRWNPEDRAWEVFLRHAQSWAESLKQPVDGMFPRPRGVVKRTPSNGKHT
jgi:hypothetical protein